ncbi:glycosyltransferase family 2 protein [uncultured Desulfuromonas sp.]|uniref:glycosyltransferase family 2 protein n=1 Tax=uncultured Desulfuromonas sp. TaxID=181013 RepID=UPI002AABA661|nr:glycosyltransferase family 2 protein [uncultured Desulfuromonas sp.]
MPSSMISVVVPVYNSENSLVSLYERTERVFAALNRPYELLLVEDCGQDDSWEVMLRLKREHKQVRIARLSRNFGQHNALLCGFSMARGELIVTMDDDLQNPPEEIPKLITAIEERDVDVVHGIAQQRQHSWIKNIGSSVYHRFLSWQYKGLPDAPLSNFRIARRKVIEDICQFRSPNPAVGLLLLNVTRSMASIPVEHHPRQYGRSTYSLSALIRFFFNGIIYNTDLPLKAVFCLGLSSLFLSMVLGGFYLCRYLLGYVDVSGWTTLVLVLLFFSGIGMFSLGLVGEYLTRILQEVNGVPQYIVRDKEE